ncbi:NotI family restriction endonuclease [uncultured Pseudodesulfovibrio sp.]|uniref:NotI family restriction endonuclease n=1 Tax=uncultured Pseudodesulfovibrio sp. TaxID=2035858 RepID=UPI0029C842DB|nr:NotI family restriction endonuclease [uncultured Pseudodesulfovibrio sp.]
MTKKANYGIADWYGRLYRTMTQAERLEVLDDYKAKTKKPCPFKNDMPELAPKSGTHCSKVGGVCSIRHFDEDQDRIKLGPIAATCPNRFLEAGSVFETIGEALLGTKSPIIVKEIPFLERIVAADPSTGSALNADREDVGRIDMVCVHPDTSNLRWCAVELQAVYFSGPAMTKDFKLIQGHTANSLPLPVKGRRPDFRSSGPKRLMPQLQIKVPTLRRWGKKMAVVVDKPFFDALGPMDKVSDLSNSDIVWIVVRFDEDFQKGRSKLVIDDIRQTTLERAVEGLTAGSPTTLSNFEIKLLAKINTA